MYVACLTPEADPLVVRRSMCGVPRINALLLAAGDTAAAGDWLLATLTDLRRELFLDPELQVLASVPPDSDEVVSRAARLLVESQCPATTIGLITPPRHAQLLASVEAAGDAMLHRQSLTPFPVEAIVDWIYLPSDATPIVEAIQSEAKIAIATNAAPAALGIAAVFESLRLGPRDWDRLASVATIARLIEHSGQQSPLWMEIDEHGQPFCLGPDTFTAEALERRLLDQWTQLYSEPSDTVAVDLSDVEVLPTTRGRYQLKGIRGAPPSGRYAVRIAYRMPESDQMVYWPTSVPRAAVDWDVVVQPASQWNNQA